MTEYGINIQPDIYYNHRKLYITETSGKDRYFVPVKLTLNSSNFNFDTARQDGLDFRMSESQSGTNVLQMWVSYWDYTANIATIWFKLPFLPANEIKTLYVFWGNDSDVGDSNLRYMLGEDTTYTVNYTSNLCVGGTVLGSTGTVNPENIFDGNLVTYGDIIKDGWVQYSFTQKQKISKIRVKGDGSGWQGYGFEVRASNDNFILEDVKLCDITDTITYVFSEYVFLNNTQYSQYRIVNDKGQSYWRITVLEMMELYEMPIVSTPIFLFGDDFNESDINSNKWNNGGAYTISDSKIHLDEGAWIQSPDILKHINSTYTSNYISLVAFDGLYCSSSGSWDGVMNTGAGFLCDNIVDGEGGSFDEYSRLGFELGDTKNNISKIYVYARTDDGLGNPGADINDWAEDVNNFVNIYGSTTNSGYGNIDNYSYNDLPIVYKDGPVCAFEILFPAAGQSFRYCYIHNDVGALKVTTVSGIKDLYITEFKAFRQDAYSYTDEVKWLVEEGVSWVSSPTSTLYYAHGYEFAGGENEMKLFYYWDGDICRKHNFELGGDVSTYNGTGKGLELSSYSQNYIAYYEATDKVYQGMYYRDDSDNYDDVWERKVHRNTDPNSFMVYGQEHYTAGSVEIDWIIVREYTIDDEFEIDYSELYIPYEEIPQQPLDFTEYTSDITSTDYYHWSDMGGDPYKLSDNTIGSLTNIFYSDVTTSGSVLIDFGRKSVNLVDVVYPHFDNNRVPYYNASKLSDFDTDRFDRNYWQCTTSSGVWAAITLPTPKMVGCLVVKAVDGKLGGMIKDFNFYGSNKDPRLASTEDKYLLYSGTFNQVIVKQSVHFTTNSRLFKYYILEAINSYGDNVALQEWEMYELDDDVGKKVVSQVRLHPAAFEANEYYFPKNIEFYGSNNLLDWVLLLNTTRTSTPFYDAIYGRWQRHSIDNENAYYSYKLVCLDNWNAVEDIIKIDEWEMVIRMDEEDNFRILDGTSTNVNNVWADPTTSFEEGNVYITNDKFNVVMDDTLIESTTVSGLVSDMNIRI